MHIRRALSYVGIDWVRNVEAGGWAYILYMCRLGKQCLGFSRWPEGHPGFGRIGQGLMVPEIMSGMSPSGKLRHGIQKFLVGIVTEPVFLNVYGAPELIPRNEFRQPM
jgi:hypothetical protein